MIPLINLVIFCLPPLDAHSFELDSLPSLQVLQVGPSRFLDQKTGTIFEYEYSAHHRLKSLKTLDQDGKLIEKIYFSEEKLNDQEWHQEKLIEIEPNELPDDRFPERTSRIGKSTLELYHCHLPDLSPEKLENLFISALNQGVKCMSTSSSVSRNEGLKLRLLFENPQTRIKIFCSSDPKHTQGMEALALAPPEHEFTGILLNTVNPSMLKAPSLTSTLFHEMLHWFYYPHGFAFDTPYLAEFCCFRTNLKKTEQSRACHLLNLSPRPLIESEAYLIPFTELMIANRRNFIPLRVLKTLMAKKITDSRSQTPKLIHEMTQKLARNGLDTAKILNRVQDRLNSSLENGGTPNRSLASTSIEEQAMEAVINLVHAAMTHASYETFESLIKHNQTQLVSLLKKVPDVQKRKRMKSRILNWLNEFSELAESVPYSKNPFKETPEELWETLEKSI